MPRDACSVPLKLDFLLLRIISGGCAQALSLPVPSNFFQIKIYLTLVQCMLALQHKMQTQALNSPHPRSSEREEKFTHYFSFSSLTSSHLPLSNIYPKVIVEKVFVASFCINLSIKGACALEHSVHEFSFLKSIPLVVCSLL